MDTGLTLRNARVMDKGGLDSQLIAQWARVRGRLRAEFGEAAFRSWLKPLTLVGHNGNEVRVAVPTRFMRDWILSHYVDRLRTLWNSENSQIDEVEVVVESGRSSSARTAVDRGAEDDSPVETVDGVALAPEPRNQGHEDVSAPLDPRFTFENFVVGKSNELAYAAARRVAEARTVPFNPLFLYGGVGLGKTHLMHGIAWHIRTATPNRRVIYLSAEKFMYQFIRALRHKNTMAFKEQFRSVDVLMIDDVQFISGKDSTQEEFFHTFNALVDQNRQVIISADKSPSDLEGLEERMRSRLGWSRSRPRCWSSSPIRSRRTSASWKGR